METTRTLNIACSRSNCGGGDGGGGGASGGGDRSGGEGGFVKCVEVLVENQLVRGITSATDSRAIRYISGAIVSCCCHCCNGSNVCNSCDYCNCNCGNCGNCCGN